MRNRENRKANQFFIDPTGKSHKFKGDSEDITSLHYEIAHILYPNEEQPKDRLMKDGWVLVGSTVYNCPIIHKKPTQAQIDKLHDLKLLGRLCFLYNNYYPNYIKYGALIN